VSAVVAPRLPAIPAPGILWKSAARWIWAAYGLFVIWATPHFIVQYWFNQSLGFRTLFATNLAAQALLFVGFGGLFALALSLPFRRYATSPGLRSAAPQVAVWAGTLLGYLHARQYQEVLLWRYGLSFGETDPVFGRDVGFYVFDLPFLERSVEGLLVIAVGGLAASLLARADALSLVRSRERGLRAAMAGLVSPGALGFTLMIAAAAAGRTWLGRYGLLLRDNADSGVRAGAEYLDVTGLLSSVNLVTVTTLVEIGLGAAACAALLALSRGRPLRAPARAAGVLLVVELAFWVGVVVRDHVLVAPNEPLVQLDYIRRHMDATLRGYRLDDVEVHEWRPPEEEVSSEEILASETVRNAPFLSSWVSWLEEPPDVQHYERISISGSKMVYGPLLQIYGQQQKLRPYYDFLSVDGVRYSVDGQKRMFVSAARELPSIAFVGPQEWLRYWGSAALLFTHGMGLVMSPVNRVDEMGNPLYVSSGVPPLVEVPALEHEPRIYFGEGMKDDYVLTNVRGIREFDYATEQFREEFVLPEDVPGGIRVDGLLRRTVLALYTGDFTAFLFSRYIDPERTRVHVRRTPISRATALAPFLFLDSNPYAFVAEGRTLWMVNGLTTSDRYPYSFREVLGDKADERAVEWFPERRINYAEDAVKITIDAFTGEIRFYKTADDPIVDTWARIYPDLFETEASMPVAVREQLTYPLQWFHVQFDDIYKRYHQRDPLEFYNVEDLWDDADEVLGSIGRGLSAFGTTDQMTFSYEAYDALIDPVDLPAGVDVGEPGDLQFTRMMPFTPEGARNLRSLVMAFQDPASYGRLVSLQIPQGTFVPGPEQVDAYIDNDRPVHQQVTMWIRHGSEVIRGSTLLLPVKGDLLYLEPIWVSSIQNELPQLKLFAVRYRDGITSGTTLEEAILGIRPSPPAAGPAVPLPAVAGQPPPPLTSGATGSGPGAGPD